MPVPPPRAPRSVQTRSVHTRRRVAAVLLGAALIVAVAASIWLGSNRIGAADVWHGLLGTGSAQDHSVVWGSRVPRTVIGLLVGAALGVAGVLMQGHTRNPLADPGLFGVSAGASLAVVLGVHLLHATRPEAMVWLSLGGALVGAVAVFAVAVAGSGAASPVPLALAGTAVSALLAALTSFIVLTDQTSLDAYRLWVVGSLAGRQLGVVSAVWPFLVVGGVLAMLNTRALDNLALGEEMARGLGERVVVARITGLAAITLLTAGATAAAGPVGFVGLTVPHLARAVVGNAHARLVPVSALVGAGLVVLADVIGRLVTGGAAEIEVGVVLACIGGPVFVAVARRRSLASL